MTNEDFARTRLEWPEGPLIERKPIGDHKDWLKTLVAFANSTPENERAILFVGASDQRPHKGLSDKEVDDAQRRIAEMLKDKCYPPIKAEYAPFILEQDGKHCHLLAVIVPASETRPHFAGPAYVRNGSRSPAASAEVYKDLIAANNSTAGRLLAWKKQQIQWKLTGTTGLYYLGNTTVMDCMGTSAMLQDDNTGYSWPTPLEKITYLDRGTLRPVLEVKYWASDRELIEYMLNRWIVFISTTEPLYHQQVAYIKKQADLHPELFHPVVKAMVEAGNTSKPLIDFYDELNHKLGKTSEVSITGGKNLQKLLTKVQL
jgi:hypothetical protein